MSGLLKKTCLIPAFLIIALIFYILFSRGASGAYKPAGQTMFALNTVIEINIYDENLNGEEKQSLLNGCFALINGYEKKLSAKIADSETDRINSAGGAETIVSSETLELIKTACEYSEITGGCFDITVKPLVDLWGIGTNDPQIPDAEKIDVALSAVGYKNIEFTDKGVRLKNGAQIDLGGIAKGYIADKTAEYLKQNGCRSALIDMGGNIVAVGNKPDGSKWKIGVREPFREIETLAGVLEVSDMSAVTSGAYERFFERDGEIYHHILDPSTGRPSESDLDSTTIISKKSADSDALSTACFVMGGERAFELLESLPETEGVLIKKDGSLLKTSGIGEGINFSTK